jgi:hypothetical protein
LDYTPEERQMLARKYVILVVGWWLSLVGLDNVTFSSHIQSRGSQKNDKNLNTIETQVNKFL